MNKFVKVKDDIDKATQSKIKTILRRYKYSQDKLVNEISALVIDNISGDGKIILSPNLVAEVRQTVTANLNDLSNYQIDFVTDIVEDCYTTALSKTAKLIGMKTEWGLVRQEMID